MLSKGDASFFNHYLTIINELYMQVLLEARLLPEKNAAPAFNGGVDKPVASRNLRAHAVAQSLGRRPR
ncbi:MAG: hypothetical protein NTU80_07600 [Verrucomicrobia bacterium]|nr:hypothetical protein [Verrucomicrobiota bacterium]